MIASPSREPRLREGSGDASEIDRESVEWGRGRGRTESAIADKSHRAADNAPLSPSSGAATLKAFQPRHHSYIFLSPLSLPYSLSPASCVSFSPNVPRSFHPFHPSCLPHHHPYLLHRSISFSGPLHNQLSLQLGLPLSCNDRNDLNFFSTG